jgi:hypothetical protein
MNGKTLEILVEVPCFKCLFADPKMESHLQCNANTCEKLTEWLLMQVEQDEKKKETVKLTVIHTETIG